MNLSECKVKYICEYNEKLGIKTYYKQNYLSELNMWGCLRKITKSTFKKREQEGHYVEYCELQVDKNEIRQHMNSISTLIDLAIDTNDREWFYQLCKNKNKLMKLLK